MKLSNLLLYLYTTFTYKQKVNIYFFYKINLRSYTEGAEYMPGNSLFGASMLTKNADSN